MAHKADMLRTRLIARYGGMWLDADAIVLSDLNFIFDYLDQYDFVGFNDRGQLTSGRPWIRINCFAARPGSEIMQAWVTGQDEMLPKLKFDWEEIGTNLLHQICLARKDIVRILPFETIAPITWNQVAHFGSPWRTPAGKIDSCTMVMLSNKALENQFPQLRKMRVAEIANAGIYISHFMRRAMDKSYVPPTRFGAVINGLCRMLRGAA